MIDQNHVAALTALLGDKGIVTGGSDVASYPTGARYDQGRAAIVLRPQTTK